MKGLRLYVIELEAGRTWFGSEEYEDWDIFVELYLHMDFMAPIGTLNETHTLSRAGVAKKRVFGRYR